MTKKRIHEIEDRGKEFTQSEQQIKETETNEHCLRDLWTMTKELTFKTSEYKRREESVTERILNKNNRL